MVGIRTIEKQNLKVNIEDQRMAKMLAPHDCAGPSCLADLPRLLYPIVALIMTQ
jgi:hypothetical protein